MSLEIRPITLDEFVSYARAVARGFGHHFNEATTPLTSLPFEDGRVVAAIDDGEFAGGSLVSSLEMTVPGEAVLPTAFVDSASVQPTHRRKGILTKIMAYHLKDMRERGESFCALSSSESIIYGRFGFGVGTLIEQWSIEKPYTAFAIPPVIRGRLRFVEKDEARKLFPEALRRACSWRPGFIPPNDALWDLFFADPEQWRSGASAYFHVVYEADGRVDGFVSYRLREQKVIVRVLASATDEAYAALWQYCFGIDLMTAIEVNKRPLDEPLPWMLADSRRLRRSVRDDIWLRVVNVPEALASRRYLTEGRLALDVCDAFCSWNQGRYELHGGPDGAECKPTAAEPDIALSAADLAAVYLGAVSFSALSHAGRVEERLPGALRRADAMFAPQVQPWMPLEV